MKESMKFPDPDEWKGMKKAEQERQALRLILNAYDRSYDKTIVSGNMKRALYLAADACNWDVIGVHPGDKKVEP